MIEVTKEMVQLVYSRIDFVNHGDDGIAEGLAEVLALVAQDRCLAPAGHVYHPLAKPRDPRAPHSHVCISCTPDDVTPGPGCINCRNTGMDQTPCNEPGHEPQCPHGCCDQARTDSETSAEEAR